MNILLINDSIDIYGGAENSVINTKKILEKKEHEVILLGEKTREERTNKTNCHEK